MEYVDAVSIDFSHISLIYSLILSLKPKSILELGYGSGRTSSRILEAISFNNNNPEYTIVDNWLDNQYKIPDNIPQDHLEHIITSDEESYLKNCTKKFDFIVSDADHGRTDQWFEHVYYSILSNYGILIYHDVSNEWPNLLSIHARCVQRNIYHKLFNKSTLETERCERGLFVIFKD